jgi:hypothetical protein
MIKRIFAIALFVVLFLGGSAFGATLDRGVLHIQYADAQRTTAEYAMRVLEDAIKEYAPHLPVGTAPIDVLIVDKEESFKPIAGSLPHGAVAGIAKPWRGIIAVKAPRLLPWGTDFSGTLRHELVHVLMFRATNPDNLPRWMNEGLAMYLSEEHRFSSTFSVARMFVTARIIDYRDLDMTFLAPGDETAFGDAYAEALSMTSFLHDWVGEDNFWKIVLGAKDRSFPDSLRALTGHDIFDFWYAYTRSLWWVTLLSAMASGSFFAPIALLAILAWWRKYRKNQRILQLWEIQEAEEAALGVQPFWWDEVVDDPDAWKQGTANDEDDEAWRGGSQ